LHKKIESRKESVDGVSKVEKEGKKGVTTWNKESKQLAPFMLLYFGHIREVNLNFKIQISLPHSQLNVNVLGIWISFLFHMHLCKN